MAGKPTFSPVRLPEILRDTIIGLVRLDGRDLSTRQLAVFLECYLEPGPHTVRGLAELLEVSKPAITRSLDRLSELGLARRRPDPADRRSIHVGRTRDGNAYLSGVTKLLAAAAAAQTEQVAPPQL